MMNIKLIILLHGVGSSGSDLIPVGQFWQNFYPDLQIATPNAPFQFMHSQEAFQWFSIHEVTEANRLQRIEQVRADFDLCIQKILEQHQLQDHLDQVMFCGFSQGTIMALDAVISGRWPVAGVIGFSGRLAGEPAKDLAHKPKIFLLHGQDDRVIPMTESVQANEYLLKAGFNTQLQIFENLEHSINQAELQACLSFIQQD